MELFVFRVAGDAEDGTGYPLTSVTGVPPATLPRASNGTVRAKGCGYTARSKIPSAIQQEPSDALKRLQHLSLATPSGLR